MIGGHAPKHSKFLHEYCAPIKMEADFQSIHQELEKLRTEEENLVKLLDATRANIRYRKTYGLILKDLGKEYAEYSNLIYASFLYTPNQNTATSSDVVHLDLECSGQFVEVYRYTKTVDVANNSILNPASCACKLEDILRFYGRSKKLGFSPCTIISKYRYADLGCGCEGTLFGKLGELLNEPSLDPAFEYFADNKNFLETCDLCSRWKPSNAGLSITTDLLSALSWFEGYEQILCDCNRSRQD